MNPLAKLPVFITPTSIADARFNITNLGQTMAEHAYLIGQNLVWIKSQLKHGEFIPWVEENVWFVRSTAHKFMDYTKHCSLSNSLEKYPLQANVHTVDISNEPAEIQQGQYNTVIIDPPWPYGTQYDSDTRRVASPYPEMSIGAIRDTAFPFGNDCVLWFWTTHKFLPVSYEILQDWGFDYKATMVWNKDKMGIGYWLRMQCEFCLLAIRGNPVWNATDVRDIISESRREHSRKPEQFYKMVLNICPQPIGEAFSRQARVGIEIITSNEPNKFKQMVG